MPLLRGRAHGSKGNFNRDICGGGEALRGSGMSRTARRARAAPAPAGLRLGAKGRGKGREDVNHCLRQLLEPVVVWPSLPTCPSNGFAS